MVDSQAAQRTFLALFSGEFRLAGLVPRMPVFQSAPLGVGDTYTSPVFTAAGTYNYIYGIHGAMMTGTVTVQAGVPGTAQMTIVDFAPAASSAPSSTAVTASPRSARNSRLTGAATDLDQPVPRCEFCHGNQIVEQLRRTDWPGPLVVLRCCVKSGTKVMAPEVIIHDLGPSSIVALRRAPRCGKAQGPGPSGPPLRCRRRRR